MELVNRWKAINGSIIREPHDFLAEYDETNEVGFPAAFMLVSFLAVMTPLVILAVVLNITAPTDAVLLLGSFLVFGIFLWLAVLVEAVVAHGIAYLFGARGVGTTLEAYAFPTLVRYAVWWVPLLNFAFGIYGLYLQIKGLASFHEIPTPQAAIAGILALVLGTVLFWILAGLVVGFVITFFFEQSGSTGPQTAMSFFGAVA